MGPLLVTVGAGVATVTLNRPEVRNALDAQLRREIPETITQLDHDPDVDAIILTGTDPAFSAGLDLKELGSLETPPEELMAPVIPAHTTPLLGAVNGPSVTGGLELALGCDFLVASERARFADTHARVGIMPGWGLTVLLPQAIGLRRAREMSSTGRYVDAATALAWGLVNHVVPHTDLLVFCTELAEEIASSDAIAVRRLLRTYDEGCRVPLDEAWAIESHVARDWFRTSYGGSQETERRRSTIVERGRTQIGHS